MERRYTCADVAQLYNVQIVTVWDWIRRKKLPAIKLGKNYAIRKEDIQAFEEKNLTNKPVGKK